MNHITRLGRCFSFFAVFLTLGGATSSLSFTPRPLHFALAVDMTPTAPEYLRSARVVLQTVLTKQVKGGDSFTLRRVCGYVATIADYEVSRPLSPAEVQRLTAEALKPCAGHGSAITQALRGASSTAKKTAFLLITDGGLENDPLKASFPTTSRGILNTPNTAAFFAAGLTTTRAGAGSVRDTFKGFIGTDSRVILSGLLDVGNGYGRFNQLVKAARK